MKRARGSATSCPATKPAKCKKASDNETDELNNNKLVQIKTKDNVDYDLVKIIGEGVFGIVYEVVSKEKHYAMKVLKTGFDSTKEIFDKEVSILTTASEIGHENVLSLVRSHSLLDPPDRCSDMAIVTELLGPSLHEVINNARKVHEDCKRCTFPTRDINAVGKQVLKAMIHLESLKVYHLDLKPENIYFVAGGFEAEEQIGRSFQNKSYKMSVIHKKDLRIRVGDFGSSHQCLPSATIRAVPVQMQNYRAPEIFMGLPYNEKSDVWSLGCVLCEMYTGEPLFYGNDSFDTEAAQFEMIQNVVHQTPSQRMWRHAFSICSSKIKKTKFGYLSKDIPRKYNPAVPLQYNMRRRDPSAVLLFMALREVLIIDPLHRPSFDDISVNNFFR